MTLALVEMGSIFAAVCALIFIGLHPLLARSTDVATTLTQAFAFSLSCGVAFYLNNLYDLHAVPSFARFASRLPRSLSSALLLFAGSCLLLRVSPLLESRLLWSGLLSMGFVLPLRAASYALIRSRSFVERVLILGTSPLARKVIEAIKAQPYQGRTIVGVVGDELALREPPFHSFVAGSLAGLDKIVRLVRPHRIIVAVGDRQSRLPVSQLLETRMRGIQIEDGVEAYERLTGKLAIESLAPSRVILSKEFRPSRVKVAVARVSSVVIAGVGLVVLAPLLGVIAVAIWLDSPGPLFFRQERVGLASRRFTLVKFRTMRPVDRAPSEWECDNCDRITRIGKWLRRFRLDELPQLVNILRGEMNLVGPRPHPVSNFQLFVENIPLYSFRALVRPGLTGWAQIRYGYANNLEEETEKMRYDLYYIKRMSLWADLRILVETVRIALAGRRSETETVEVPQRQESALELNRVA